MAEFRRLEMGDGACPRCGEDFHVHSQRLVVERPAVRVLGFVLRHEKPAHWVMFCATCGLDYTVRALRKSVRDG